ncbi:MAG: ribosome-binding factor A, partial [Alphaproteobacteria bacterium]|nr:ribosome-binding factor A [Alphaproteobacteria bacterium]
MRKSANTARSGRSPSQRQLRVGEEIRHALAQMVSRTDFRDPDLAGQSITVTEVRVSPDLSNATVFVTPLVGEAEAIVPAVQRA